MSVGVVCLMVLPRMFEECLTWLVYEYSDFPLKVKGQMTLRGQRSDRDVHIETTCE